MNSRSGRRHFRRRRIPLAFFAAAFCVGLSTGLAADFEIIAHRGGELLFPENTRIAFQSCSGLVDQVEFDVRVSADGELVLMHDATVNRTTVGFGALTNESGTVITNVANLTLAQLKTLDAGDRFSPAFAGEQIPTLAEALRSIPAGIQAMIERKTGSPEAYVAVLRAENALSNATVSCGNYSFLLAVHALEPSLKLALIASGDLSANPPLAELKQKGIATVLWDRTSVVPALVDQVHAQGLRLYAWTVSIPAMEDCLDMGVDGLIVDNPLRAKAWIPGVPPTNEQLGGSLVAYWKLDDGLLNLAANEADDVEATSPGQLVGFAAPPSWLPPEEARSGGALRLDGRNDYVALPTNAVLDLGTNAVSIALWVKLSVLPSALTHDYAGIYDSDVDAYALYLDKNAKELRFKITDASTNAARPGIPESALRTGVWHQVVGVYDGNAGLGAGQAMIYLDGRLQDVHSGSDLVPGLGLTNLVRRQAAAFGRNGTQATYYFAGALDDVAIWRRALGPTDVKQIYCAGTNGVPLEKKVMTLWIANVYPNLETGDMEMDIRVDHGNLTTNQPLRLRGAVLANGPYVDEAVLEGGRGNQANFRVPASSLVHPGPRDTSVADVPNFFQIAHP
jgi:glycerophosphoryl diester phosphodiesterase